MTESIHQSEAAQSALSCPSERELRVPCYCEENVWRLAYRRLYQKASITSSSSTNGAISSPEERNELTSQAQLDTTSTRMDYYVVFVSNEEKCCPMFCQLANCDPNEPCFWDYHVFLLGTPVATRNGHTARNKQETNNNVVIDMDSHLPFPCPVAEYLSNAFREESFRREYREKLAPRFRVIEAELYLQHFYSDRLHMFNSETGKWNAERPQYECIMSGAKGVKKNYDKASKIKPSGRESNLDSYINMQQVATEDYTSRAGSEDAPDEASYLGTVYSIDAFRGRYC